MGALTIPASGSVYVDANVVIYAVEKIVPYAPLLDPLWSAAQSGRVEIVTSELTWLEVLAKPLMDGDAELESLFRSYLKSKEIALVPASLAIWEDAAKLRGIGLRTPDALHAATAAAAGCTLFVTNDRTFTRVPGLTVTMLSDLI